MPTVIASTTSYVTNDEFVERCDWRTVAQLLSDTETALTLAQVSASTRLTTLLKQASGEVESACLVSRRYVIQSGRNDLSSLTGNSLEYLKGLVCTLAVEKVYLRRPDLLAKVGEQVKEAREQLELLRNGERIFGYVEVAEAGLLDHHTETRANEEDRHGMSVHMERLLGQRGWRRRVE